MPCNFVLGIIIQEQNIALILSTLKMEAVVSSETFISKYQTARREIPEHHGLDFDLHVT
jgi:hypothetical protein